MADDDVKREAAEDLARAIAQDAEPGVDRAIAAAAAKAGIPLRGGRLDSESAHRISAHVARLRDAKRSRR